MIGRSQLCAPVSLLLCMVLMLAACGGGPATSPSDGSAVSIAPSPSAGPATVTFGASFDTGSLSLAEVATEFPSTTKYIAWRVEFNRALASDRLDLVMTQLGSTGIQYRWSVTVVNRESQIWAAGLNLLQWNNYAPGQYTLLVMSEDEILAEGSFTAIAP